MGLDYLLEAVIFSRTVRRREGIGPVGNLLRRLTRLGVGRRAASLSWPVLLTTFVGAAQAADAIRAVDLVGDAFVVTMQSGRTLRGGDLKGATMSLRLTGFSAPVRVTLADIVPAPDDAAGDTLLYHVLIPDPAGGPAQHLCEADLSGGRWAVPLEGRWTAEGLRQDGDGFTFACTATALGKCVRFGYPPWRTLPDGTILAPYHQACVHMVRGDYCGGHGTTRDGMLIDFFDRIGIAQPARQELSVGLAFEAAWGVEGALCVAHTRIPAQKTLDDLNADCPRLRGRLGKEACVLEAAQAGRYGPALLFNKSQ